ncbi:MAG: SEC-C domain-containing protein [Desulfamplus sp.]|nr:SEC-C domain-containing protein [Desulfamplus sp.]
MGGMADAMFAYTQPLLDDTDGSQEQMQYALTIAQLCWNIALLPEAQQREAFDEMRPFLKIGEDEIDDFYETVVFPMVKRHREMFPNLHNRASKNVVMANRNEKYPGTGRNDRCPCGSGKKYKKCCGQ